MSSVSMVAARRPPPQKARWLDEHDGFIVSIGVAVLIRTWTEIRSGGDGSTPI
jgi:hypothetical protein